MNDYFDELEVGLRDAVRRRAHLPWYRRLSQLSLQHRGLAVVFTALVVATPAVAAVGAVAGWFSKGRPDVFYRGAANAGLGKAVRGSRMLPIRVADPAGGPPWGLRLVKTSRGATCVQVGRVENGQLVSLGIDGSWGNDHRFHAISPNDGVFDTCGATDRAGHGFVSSQGHGWPASAYAPTDYGHGKAFAFCQPGNPVARLKARLRLFPQGSKSRRTFEAMLRRLEAYQRRSRVKPCPNGSLRMISVGLLGPEAKSITYRTPSGTTKIEDTVGGVGAYLIVFKQTAADCNDFTQTAVSSGGNGCAGSYGGTDSPDLRQPNSVTGVTYQDGHTCTDQPSAGLVSAFRDFTRRMRPRFRKESAAQERAQMNAFFAAHGVKAANWILALMPICRPVGWVNSSAPRISAKQVRAALQVRISEGRRFCSKDSWTVNSVQDHTIVCDNRIPKGYRAYWQTPAKRKGPMFALVKVSFIARQPVTTTNSFYQWQITYPGQSGAEGNRTQANVRRGERITFTMSEPIPGTGRGWHPPAGIYHATISFVQNVGQAGPETGGYGRRGGGSTVGTFSFRLPPHH